MRYRNNTLAAQMACELARTGNYGDDYTGKAVHICATCGAEIYSGDRMVYEAVPICEDCIRNMTAAEFCDLNDIREEIV